MPSAQSPHSCATMRKVKHRGRRLGAGEGLVSLKLKRHYKLIVMLVLVAAVLALGFGDRRIVAYTVDDSSLWTSSADSEVVQASSAASSEVSLFDDTTTATIPTLGYDPY
jgi:hypothetical protein